MFPDTFATARLAAERLTPEHFAAIRAMDSDPAYMALLGGVRDVPKTQAYMDRNLKHWDDYGFGCWVLRDARDGEVAGRCIIRHLDVEGTDEVELGYGFHPRYWGQGLATEIAKELLRIGREKLGIASLVAITMRANRGSQRVLEKAGLVYERDIVHDGVTHMLYRSVT